MAEDAWLLFQGRLQRDESGALRVHEALRGDAPPFEIEGAHAQAAAIALAHAMQPRRASELTRALAERAELPSELAHELVQQLLDAEILRRNLSADQCFRVLGDCAVSHALRALLSHALWPAELPAPAIAVLGTLGSAGWHVTKSKLAGRSDEVLTCSLERAGAFIGPWLGRVDAACPECLASRRWAADADMLEERATSSQRPLHADALCALILAASEQWARAELAPDAVLHVEGTRVTTRTLLRQPGCGTCTPQAVPDDPRGALERTVRALWSEDGAEPSAADREPFFDPVLGPLELHEYSYPDLFRGLPLVLGSIRLVQNGAQGRVRRELPSVTFGTGASDERRKLVAYAEGIERYAGTTDQPDVRAKSFSALAPPTLAPADTIRFAADQYAPAGTQLRYTDQPLDWSWAYDWSADGACLVPHDCVALARTAEPGSVQLYREPFSSGFAAHRTLPLALQRALVELIERDAFMLAWYLRLPLVELRLPPQLDPWLAEMLDYLQQRGVHFRFFDLRVDFDVPCLLALATADRKIGPWQAGGSILSSSGGTSLLAAARHAVEEILGHYSVFGVVAPNQEAGIDPATGEARLWWPSFAAYLQPRQDDSFAFLTGRAVRELSAEQALLEQGEQLESIKQQLAARSLRALVRLLPAQGSGLVALRAFVPGLIRLAPARDEVNLGERRIAQVAERWGVSTVLNPLPHPLA